MKKKIRLSLLVFGGVCALFFLVLIYYSLFDFNKSLLNVFQQESSVLSQKIEEQINQHRTRSLAQMKKSFFESCRNKIEKDSRAIVSDIIDFSIFGVRNFIANTYQNDADIVAASLVVADETGYKLWQHIDRQHPLGLDLNSTLDMKSRTWKSFYQGEKVIANAFFLDDDSRAFESLYIKEDSDGESILIVNPIIYEGVVKGYLSYTYSLNNIVRQIEDETLTYRNILTNIASSANEMELKFEEKSGVIIRFIIFLSFIFMLFFLIGAFIYSNYAGTKLASPILKLLEATDKVGQGIYEVHEVIKSNDEVELLSEHLNDMIVAIKQRDEQLLVYQNNLEGILAKRTRELEDQRAINIQESKLRSIGEMAAGISHEINNPLAVINPSLVMIRRLLKHKPVDLSKIEKNIIKIEEMSYRIEEIVKGIKDFSRDQTDMVMDEFSLDDLIEACGKICRQQIKNQGVRYDIASIPSVTILGKLVELSQVLINLINNAFYAVKDIKDADQKWIEIRFVQKDENSIYIETLNGGKKIDQDIVEKVMEPFFTTKPQGEGTGLGLSISRGIMKSYGGDIFVDLSKQNTCFTMVLPLIQKESKLLEPNT